MNNIEFFELKTYSDYVKKMAETYLHSRGKGPIRSFASFYI
jgi:hypothetical protein